MLIQILGLYTDESPGLKVDPFVVLVLSVGFIISVVALHRESITSDIMVFIPDIHLVIAKISRRFSS